MNHLTTLRRCIVPAIVAALGIGSTASAATLATYDFESAASPFVDVTNFAGVSVTDLSPGAKLATDDGRSTFTTPVDGGVGSYFARGASLNQPDSGTSDAFVDAQSQGGYLEFTITADDPIDRAEAEPLSLLLWCGFSRAARRAARVHRPRR